MTLLLEACGKLAREELRGVSRQSAPSVVQGACWERKDMCCALSKIICEVVAETDELWVN